MYYYVSKDGSNQNPGTSELPFLTINKAARVAQPGDIITVRGGTYREWVNPKRGGTAGQRITYQAAEGEKVTITGAEVVTDWKKDGALWKLELDNSYFGDFNPYEEKLYGDWLMTGSRVFHLGEVYLDGRSMYEMDSLELVKNPVESIASDEPEFSFYTWYCETNDKKTTIYANFQGEDPTKGNVEINVRPFVFWPAKPGCGYITVRGFTMKQAATQWAPPTAFQEGLIGPHWSKGWIIEDNIISDSRCSGISLGKDEATGHNEWTHIKAKQGTQREREVIFRAQNNNWNKDNIGSHIVRNNVIFNCGQTGIVGHLGCVFSRIENNHIYDILHKREFNGAETGGIKLHAAIDTVISGNVIHNSYRGLWLDWQAQGTHVSRNTFFDNDNEDLFIEVSHGPTTVDHNIFLSDVAFKNMAQGIALIHNLFAGRIALSQELSRYTPYHAPHSTSVAGVMLFMGGDDRYYNNVFLRPSPDYTPDEPRMMNFFNDTPVPPEGSAMARFAYMGYPVGTAAYSDYPQFGDEMPWDGAPAGFAIPQQPRRKMGHPPAPANMPPMTEEMRKRFAGMNPAMAENAKLPVAMENNLYFNKAMPWPKEKGARVEEGTGIEAKVDHENKKVVIRITNPALFTKNRGGVVGTEMLGYGFQAEMLFEKADGSPHRFDTDFNGKAREGGTTPGPFQVEKEEVFEISFEYPSLI